MPFPDNERRSREADWEKIKKNEDVKMNNLDKMKTKLTDWIQKMSVQQFENLVTVLNGSKDIYKFDEPLEVNELFDCEVCEKHFENCEVEDDSDTCSKRFREYAMEKCKE